MGSTNHTSNYELSQFLGSDKPAWLLDYNGDMLKIDTQMKANADAASAAQSKADTADGKADDLRTDLTTLNNQVNDPTGLAADVATLSGNVNTINSLIGNGEPTTTDKTLIGAINELNSNKAPSDYGSVSVTADGTKDIATLLGELFALVDDTKLKGTSFIKYGTGIYQIFSTDSTKYVFCQIENNFISELALASTGTSKATVFGTDSVTMSDRSAHVPTAGVQIIVNY